ncbi:DUF1798 family protein [Pontibacillus yanchengensis]|uniref:DUF1798 family protein n=1 Tax=Pontibacillus yanchengensis TaxID=462910 RepID=UPI001928CEDC|nr:DUF1798 family protein [Pontibacillus yanchengensis]
MSSKLENQIWTIKQELNQLKDRFLASDKPADKKDRALFEQVKEETSPLFTLIQEWYDEAEQYVKMNPGSKVFPIQLENTKDNFELLVLHSYYIDVPKKRFMELYNSVHYVLDQLLDNFK